MEHPVACRQRGPHHTVLGLSFAWITVRYEFPGRRIWEWALALPLAMPTYVLAYVYAHLLGMGGPAEQWWQSLLGPEARLLSPHSFVGVTLIMALDTFPFVYLLVREALLNLNISFEEVARVCGVSPSITLWRVTLPLIRPAIAAGLALVILYVISDFGAVSLAPLPNTHLCGLPANDQPLRPHSRQHSQLAARRDGDHFPCD